MAEDSSFQRKIITDILLTNEEIAHVELARNGREAIEKVEAINPDVLILDLMMPEVDGIEVFKFLSEHYPIPTIIFSSTNPETLDDSIQALLLGAFAVIPVFILVGATNPIEESFRIMMIWIAIISSMLLVLVSYLLYRIHNKHLYHHCS